MALGFKRAPRPSPDKHLSTPTRTHITELYPTSTPQRFLATMLLLSPFRGLDSAAKPPKSKSLPKRRASKKTKKALARKSSTKRNIASVDAKIKFPPTKDTSLRSFSKKNQSKDLSKDSAKGPPTRKSSRFSLILPNRFSTYDPPQHIDIMPDLPLKDERPSSPRDSKFSALSVSLESLESFSFACSEPFKTLVSIPRPQLERLQSLTRRATRALRKQEYLCSAFSANMSCLMGRKEHIILLATSLPRRAEMLALIRGLRSLVGKTLLRKAVFLQRSLQLLQGVAENLFPFTYFDEDNDDASADVEISLDIENISQALQTVTADLHAQAELDAALRTGISGPCEDGRLPASEGERVAMRRFVAFVDGRLESLRDNYEAVSVLVAELDMKIGTLTERD